LRVLAAACAGLILLLTAASVSPALHAWLHGESLESAHDHICSAHDHGPAHGEDEHPAPSPEGHVVSHDCAISLFAHGVTLAHAFLVALDQPRVVQAVDIAPSCRVILSESRHLRPQPQAPPAG
jgi:hypothetical protein